MTQHRSSSTSGSDAFTRRLATADPARALQVSTGSLDRLLPAAINRAESSHPRRRLLAAGVAVAAVVTVGVTTPAFAEVSHFIAETGWFGSPNPGGSDTNSSEYDHSEWIDSSKSDFVKYAVSVSPTSLPLPAGYDANTWAATSAEHLQGHGLMQTVNIQRRYEAGARCFWVDAWTSADRAGDAPAAASAAKRLAQSATWPATVSTDGGGVVKSLKQLASNAASGERRAVTAQTADECSPFLDEAGR